MQPTKFCKDCKHFDSAHQHCLHEQAIRINPLTGAVTYVQAIVFRMSGHPCGVEANHYEAKK